MGLCISTNTTASATPSVVPVTVGEFNQVSSSATTAKVEKQSIASTPVVENNIVQQQEQSSPKPNPAIQKNRRKSVSSEVAKFSPSTTLLPKEMKDAATREKLLGIVSKVLILQDLDVVQKMKLADAMFERPVKANDVIIRQGDEGDNFYIIERGTFTATKDGSIKYVYENSGSFGELALMYDCPRAATITANSNGLLWGLDRQTFRVLVIASAIERRKRNERFLRSVKLFKDLEVEKLAAIADCLEIETFEEKEVVIKQGQQLDAKSKFYILEEGTVECYRTTMGTRKLTRTLQPGDVFGEYALLTDEPRQADCIATTPVKCLTLSRNAFERLMGNGELKGQVEEYRKLNYKSGQSIVSPAFKSSSLGRK